jgi:uncharacterized protein with PIN domain
VTTTYVPISVQKDRLNYNKVFADARKDKQDKMNRCFRCNWPFQVAGDGEVVSVVHFKGHGNKLVCDDCADWILRPEKEGGAQ